MLQVCHESGGRVLVYTHGTGNLHRQSSFRYILENPNDLLDVEDRC